MPTRILRLFFTLVFPTIAIAQGVPHSAHVWLLSEENHSYEQVVGNSGMPYFNKLLERYGVAEQFYSRQHSSLPALMWYVAGAKIEPNNETVSCHHDQNNIVRQLLREGYSWRAYQSNMPYAGYQKLFGGQGDTYYRRHNPIIDFTDACPGTGQEDNSAPFSEMQSDFSRENVVNFAYITPDAVEDAHSASLEKADKWLEEHVPSILERPEFQDGGDGLLFIIWDESHSGDTRCSAQDSHGCGGRIPVLVIGPQVKSGYRSTKLYHSENVLKTVCEAMRISDCPGAAQNAEPMSDFF